MRSHPKPPMIGFVTAIPRRWYLVVGVFLVALASLLALSVLGGAPATAAGLACALTIVFSVRLGHDRTKAAAAWYLLAAGAALLAATAVLGAGQGRFAVRDGLLTAGVLAVAGGIGWLVAARSSAHDWGSVIDTAAATFAAALIIWVTLLAPELSKSSIAVGVKLAASSLPCLAGAVRALGAARAGPARLDSRGDSPLPGGRFGDRPGGHRHRRAPARARRSHPGARSLLILTSALLAACALDPSMRELGDAASERRDRS